VSPKIGAPLGGLVAVEMKKANRFAELGSDVLGIFFEKRGFAG
jgi:hypothetical protein